MNELRRVFTELRSLLTSPTTGNIEAARAIVDGQCAAIGLLPPMPVVEQHLGPDGMPDEEGET